MPVPTEGLGRPGLLPAVLGSRVGASGHGARNSSYLCIVLCFSSAAPGASRGRISGWFINCLKATIVANGAHVTSGEARGSHAGGKRSAGAGSVPGSVPGCISMERVAGRAAQAGEGRLGASRGQPR